jgi:hypothetical protein
MTSNECPTNVISSENCVIFNRNGERFEKCHDDKLCRGVCNTMRKFIQSGEDTICINDNAWLGYFLKQTYSIYHQHQFFSVLGWGGHYSFPHFTYLSLLVRSPRDAFYQQSSEPDIESWCSACNYSRKIIRRMVYDGCIPKVRMRIECNHHPKWVNWYCRKTFLFGLTQVDKRHSMDPEELSVLEDDHLGQILENYHYSYPELTLKDTMSVLTLLHDRRLTKSRGSKSMSFFAGGVVGFL